MTLCINIFQYFPVVYSTKNPENSDLLVIPADFAAWQMQFPDSLHWVKSRIGF